MSEKIQKSAEKVARWVEGHDYKAFDPGDGNLSILHPLTFNHQFLERVLQQIVYRAPWNVRALLGIRPHTSTKGMGYFAWGYLKMFTRTGREEFADRARNCLKWLTENNSPGHAGYCWGNHFLFSSRGGRIPKLEPTIVWSGLIGQAFLDAHEILKSPQYLEIAASICHWAKTLPREITSTGICLSYTSQKQSSIHNSNLIGAALLARTGVLTGDREALELACRAAQYSCARLRKDGSWLYAEKGCAWVDSFHTGYNLDSLKRYSHATGDHQFDADVLRAYEFFKRNFFEPSGRPKYYHNQTYPVDIQCAAQAIDTLSFFSDIDPEGLPMARKVAEWTIDNMQDRDGHFYYRRNNWTINRAPMLHWGQGTMFKALAHFLQKSSEQPTLNQAACPAARPANVATDAPASGLLRGFNTENAKVRLFSPTRKLGGI
jgi:rhamnogalacturonyl hydrolase YesR